MRRLNMVLILVAAVLVGVAGGGLWLRGQRNAPVPGSPPVDSGNATVTPPAPETREATVYFAREATEGDYDFVLVPVKRTVTVEPSGSLGQAALEALAKGTTADERSKGLVATLPAGTRVLGVTVEEGVATADFSADLRDKFPGGSGWEEAVVNSVVDTLTDIEGIRRVRITLDGKPVDSIGGHVGVDEPMSRNAAMIARGTGQ